MSILIRDMEMPTDCCQCKLARYDDYENETFCPFTDVMCLSIGRQDDCPLEEVPETHEERTETHACDYISRQAAIDAVEMLLEQSEDDEHDKTWNNAIRGAINSIEHHVPSAQPEIIRCKDCKHHHYEIDIPYCDRTDYGYGWKDNDYCSRAERRTDGF